MNGYQAYATTNNLVDEDDKPKILLKVYRAMLDKHEIVKAAIREKDYKRKYEELSKITTVLELLNNSLDMSLGEIPQNLSSIYVYLIGRLRQAHTTLDVEGIIESEEIVKNLLDGFTSAYANLKNQDISATQKPKIYI